MFFILIDGPRVHAIDAQISKTPMIRRIASSHITCIKDISVELSPTRRKLKAIVGFKMCDKSEGWIPFRYTEG